LVLDHEVPVYSTVIARQIHGLFASFSGFNSIPASGREKPPKSDWLATASISRSQWQRFSGHPCGQKKGREIARPSLAMDSY
jgi:hypothetical protein